MKEYTITMKFLVESEESDYEKISEFADELSEKILNDESLIMGNDIEVTDVIIDDIENHNYEEDNMYLDTDDE